MKKLRYDKKLYPVRSVTLIVCAILLVTGCQLSPAGSGSAAATSAISSAVSSPASMQISSTVLSATKSEPLLSDMTASQIEQLEKIRLVFFQAGDFGQNICAFENGTTLASGLYPDSLVSQKLYNGTDLYLYNIRYPYTNFPSSSSNYIKYSNDFENFRSEYASAFYEWGFGGWIGFSDNNYPFKFPVTHQAYGVGAQPDRPEWRATLASLLKKTSVNIGLFDISNTPLIITDVWRFDLDGDGVDEELVRVCNQSKMNKTDFELKPAKTKTGICNSMVLFSSTLNTTVISTDNFPINNLIKDEPYTFDYRNINNLGTDATETGVWQYDADGNLILCPYYEYGESWAVIPQIPIVCDADNDGKPELIVIKHPTEYWQVAVFKAGLENGELLWCENTMHP